MKENTVLLSLERYDELKEVHDEYLENKIIVKEVCYGRYIVVSDDDATKKMAEDLKNSITEKEVINSQLIELKNTIRNMPVREFKKFRKTI